MDQLLNSLFGTSAQSVRRNVQLRSTVDADGQPVIEVVEGDAVALGPSGGIDSGRIVPDRFYHCGCNAQEAMGGQCAEAGCRRVSCNKCFGRCAQCCKPLCLEHSRFLVEGASPARLCRFCYGSATRRRRLRALAKGLLSPFVTFEEGKP